jgi:hypothetical protein
MEVNCSSETSGSELYGITPQKIVLINIKTDLEETVGDSFFF